MLQNTKRSFVVRSAGSQSSRDSRTTDVLQMLGLFARLCVVDGICSRLQKPPRRYLGLKCFTGCEARTGFCLTRDYGVALNNG